MKNSLKTALAGIIGALLLPTAAHAVMVDLTNGAGDKGIINGAGFMWTNFNSTATGTGSIDPFLRVQNSPVESGWNTSGTTFNDEKAGVWTKDIKLSAIPIVNNPFTGLSGDYYEILLDIGEGGGPNALLTLNGLQLFTSSVIIPQTTAGASDLTGSATPRYNLGSGNTVEMDGSLNAGNGKGDVLMYFPTSAFVGAGAADYFYLYAQLGNPKSSDNSFEEFAVRKGTTNNVPDGGATIALFGLSLLGMGGIRNLAGGRKQA